MRKYVVLHHADGEIDDKMYTPYLYKVGEIIEVNNRGNQYKCIGIESKNNEVIHHFKQGIATYTYDY